MENIILSFYKYLYILLTYIERRIYFHFPYLEHIKRYVNYMTLFYYKM